MLASFWPYHISTALYHHPESLILSPACKSSPYHEYKAALHQSWTAQSTGLDARVRVERVFFGDFDRLPPTTMASNLDACLDTNSSPASRQISSSSRRPSRRSSPEAQDQSMMCSPGVAMDVLLSARDMAESQRSFELRKYVCLY